MSDQQPFPQALFERQDESPDSHFYLQPRLVTHIDDATIAALTDYYDEILPSGADFLDLMSSWISHLPAQKRLGRVVGLGMNAEELAANQQLDEWRVQDLNVDPVLPFDDGSFDFAAIVVSIQYLTRPVDVMSELRRVLRPGGTLIVAMSHRLFPTKAIRAFRELPPEDRARLVAAYLDRAGFQKLDFIDRSPEGADPLWLVMGQAPTA